MKKSCYNKKLKLYDRGRRAWNRQIIYCCGFKNMIRLSAKVSESTTVRFATQLGYKGFPEFHRALEELVRNKLNSIQRMKVTYGHVPEAEILDTVFQSDIEIIKLTMEHIDHAAFEMAVETLLSARTIYIIGIRSCAPLASFLSFYLNMILDDVRLIQTSSASEIF